MNGTHRMRWSALATGLALALAGCQAGDGSWGSRQKAPEEPATLSPIEALRAQFHWHDARELGLEGKGWPGASAAYQRLPGRAEEMVPDAVWHLSHHTAGICVRFMTDSPRIAAIWDGGGAMNHMAATGNSGLDLYARKGGGWVFCGVGRPQPTQTTAILAEHLPDTLTEYLLYLPLYNRVTELKIGLTPDSRLVTPPDRPAAPEGPIVFYGTSITQGGCASRAGMCHPALLGRWLDREVVNLGFSGAGKMEMPLAALLGDIDACLYVLECLPNMTADMVAERVAPFVRRLRAVQPTTPILLVENLLTGSAGEGNEALRAAYEQLRGEGVQHLHYLPGDELLAGRENGTVDGVHPTDLGFFRMAQRMEPVLAEILR